MATQIIESDELVKVDAIWQAAYRKGIHDTLDELYALARDPRRLRGEVALAEVRRHMRKRCEQCD